MIGRCCFERSATLRTDITLFDQVEERYDGLRPLNPSSPPWERGSMLRSSAPDVDSRPTDSGSANLSATFRKGLVRHR